MSDNSAQNPSPATSKDGQNSRTKPKTIAVTGAVDEASSARASLSLAVALATSGFTTVIVNLSFGARHGLISKRLNRPAPPTYTLTDYLSGAVKNLGKTVEKSGLRNLFFVESGIDYLNHKKKAKCLFRSHLKKFLALNAEYIVFDLGVITDQARLEFFASSDFPLAITSPDSATEPFVQKLCASMALTVIDLGEQEESPLKNAVKIVQKNRKWQEVGLYSALTDELDGNLEDEDRLLWTQEKIQFYLAHDRTSQGDDKRTGAKLADNITLNLGVKTTWLGGFMDESCFPDRADVSIFSSVSKGSPVVENSRAIARKMTGEDIEVNEIIVTAAEETITREKGLALTLFQESLAREKKALARAMKEELAIEREEKRNIADTDILAYNRNRRAELDREFDGEITKKRKTELARLDTELELEKEKRLQEIFKDFLAENDSFRSAMTREVEDIRKERMATLEKDISRIRREKSKALEMSLEKKREWVEKEWEDYRLARQTEFEKKLATLEEEEREALRASLRKDVEHIKEMVWLELEESREKKIKAIDKEVELLIEKKTAPFDAQQEALRRRVREDTRKEGAEVVKALVDTAHRDVMLLSSFADDEFYLKNREHNLILDRRYEKEREVRMTNLDTELAKLRQKKIEDNLSHAAKERRSMLDQTKKELDKWKAQEQININDSLKKEVESKRKLVGSALLKRESKIVKKLELAKERRLLEVEREAVKNKTERLNEINSQANELKNRLVTTIRERLSDLEKKSVESINGSLAQLKEEREAALVAEIAKERRTKAALIESEAARRRREATEALAAEIALLRAEKKKAVEEEIAAIRIEKSETIKKDITTERIKREAELAEYLAEQETEARKKLAESIETEEESVRKRLLEELETERQTARIEMMASLQTNRVKIEAEFKQNLDDDRADAYLTLENELAALRKRHEDNIQKWSVAEKEKRLVSIREKLKQSERTRQEAINERLVEKEKEAMEEVNRSVELKRHEALRISRSQIDARTSDLLSVAEKETALARDRLAETMLEEIEADRKKLYARVVADTTDERNVKYGELTAWVEAEREEMRQEMENSLSSERTQRLTEVRRESEALEDTITQSLDERRRRLLFEQEEWVRLHGEKLKIEARKKVEDDINIERESKLLGLSNDIIEEEKNQSQKLADEERRKLKELDRWGIEERRKISESIRREQEQHLVEEKERITRIVEKERVDKLAAIGREMEKEKENRSQFLEKELEVERSKLYELLNVELKTEEYRRRQEMIADIMDKKANLDESFRAEKIRYFKKLREEILRHAGMNRDLFDEEIKRVAKSLRLN